MILDQLHWDIIKIEWGLCSLYSDLKIEKMLMKPPSIFDDVVSQDSENYTVRSKQQSLKNKPRKENTIRIGGTSAEQKDRSNERERDNQSVHSNGSKRSKDKRAKESTLARPKVSESFHKDEDTHSVHSTGSRHSQKSAKKQNNIMQRPKIQQPYSKAKVAQDNELSFKNAIGDPEESVIKRYRLDEDESPQPIRYTEQRLKQPDQKNKNKKFAPFAELEHRQGSQEEIPIFRIEQPKKIKQQVVGLTRPEQYKRAPKEEPKEIAESRQIGPDQSRSLFDQSRMANTKSVRRPIFAREELANNSKVSNIDQSNISAMESTSRRKSNSKLRQLFNNSREKGMQQSSIQNQSRMFQQSRAVKPTVGNQRMVQLERKVIEDNQFGVDSIRSGLDLTVSNNEHVEKERESLIFEFEPERKKGMTVTSKNKKLNSSQQELLKIGDQLTSARPKTIKQTTSNLPQLQPGNIQSKDLKHVDKLLRENQEFLRNSALLNLSSSDKLKRDSGDDYLFKLEDEDINPDYMLGNNALNTPWNQGRQQEPLNIKKVQRNEKPQTKSRQVEPIRNQKEQKNQQKPQPKVEIKEQAQPKKVKEQQVQLKQVQHLKKPQIRQEINKSPGKISKNFESVPSETDNKSEHSNKSVKKGKSVKESAIPRTKAHKIQFKNDGPRGDQSFYEQQPKQKNQQPSIDDLSLYSKKPEVKEEKKPNVFRFSDDQNQVSEKPKSRTDVNFYDNETRSNKPPSSRPPLSGKSNKSRSTSKDKVPKQSTLKIGNVQPADKNAFKKPSQPAPVTKKLTLMERAMMKHNESEEDNGSQESFSSREDFSQNSIKSSNSRGSRKSIKENSIKIDRKEGSLMKNRGLPPYQRKVSSNSSNHEQEMQRTEERQRSIEDARHNMVVPNQRPIVSKNCTFIDERGRLVQQDLIIKGRDVYGQSRIDDSTTQALERMRRMKESHRSRSRSRESRGQRRRSRDEGQSSSYQNSSYSSSFYQNSSYGRIPLSKPAPHTNSYGNGNQTQALRQFMKPVEQVPLYNQSNNERRSQKEIRETPRTFNDMFGKKNQQQNYNQNYAQSTVSNFSDSRSRRSLKRTQTSAKKR